MSHTLWFDAPLTCLQCGRETAGRKTQMYSSDLLIDPMDVLVAPGDAIDAEIEDFREAYYCLNASHGDDFSALEEWTCQHCSSVQWAELTFHLQAQDSVVFTAAQTVPLDSDVLVRVSYLSRKADGWVKYDPDGVGAILRPAVERASGKGN